MLGTLKIQSVNLESISKEFKEFFNVAFSGTQISSHIKKSTSATISN